MFLFASEKMKIKNDQMKWKEMTKKDDTRVGNTDTDRTRKGMKLHLLSHIYTKRIPVLGHTCGEAKGC